jgi:hypothetical protein
MKKKPLLPEEIESVSINESWRRRNKQYIALWLKARHLIGGALKITRQ